VVITAAGLLTPLGRDLMALHRDLLEGRRAVGPLDLEGEAPVSVFGATLDGQGPEDLLPGRNLRPLDRTGRLAAAAAGLALGNRGEGSDGEPPPRRRCGLVLGTMFGSVRTIAEFDRRALVEGPGYTKPFDFANSVINAAAGQAAIWHGLIGINATVAGGATAGLAALSYATDLIRAGRVDALLAGGAEELCRESVLGFAHAGLLDRRGPAVPLHADRQGFSPAEAAALFLLEDEETAQERGAVVLGRLTGSGGGFDPSRGEDPEEGARAVARAVREALADAGIGPGEVDGISLSASGSPAVDRREAVGLGLALGGVAATVPVTAVKGALGESLGAAGALQVAVLLGTFATGQLPGIAGLDRPDPELPLPQAGAANRTGSFRRGLVTAAGGDGTTCALVVEAP
jgi:3-oxoacyl-[acyl-carrier-protein] synthase II